MRLAKLDKNILNETLAVPITLYSNRKLVNRGVQITDRMFERLKKYGFNAVYIEDSNVDVELKSTLSEGNRAKIINRLNELYDEICRNNYDEFEFNKLIRNEILPEISNEPVSFPVCRAVTTGNIAEHSLNVCLLSVVMARNMGLNTKKVEIIAKAALLHDIGKLIKDDDTQIGHEQIAFKLLKDNASSVLLYTAVRFHHETLDGNGSCKLLAEKQTDIVKILSLCNYYENLHSENALLPHECFEKLKSLVNIKFDKRTFKVFAKSIYIYPIGLPVKLNNNEFAIVVGQNDHFPLRPIVRTENAQYNLLKHLSLFIDQVVF